MSITCPAAKRNTQHHIGSERSHRLRARRNRTRTRLHTPSAKRRHTYATTLANAGMSLQALMALLGHVTPEMTIRYATLASPTTRRWARCAASSP